MEYKDLERRREYLAEYRKAHKESRRQSDNQYFREVTMPKRQLATLRALLHTAQRRYNQDPCADFRRKRDRLQNAVDELVAGPELERLRSIPHPDPLLSTHAPEVPVATVDDEPIWPWLARRYWTERRRAMYRRAAS